MLAHMEIRQLQTERGKRFSKQPLDGGSFARQSGTGDVRLSYLPGLDGPRAFAVIAVLLHHADLSWIRGGFLGVEVFFVISGYRRIIRVRDDDTLAPVAVSTSGAHIGVDWYRGGDELEDGTQLTAEAWFDLSPRWVHRRMARPERQLPQVFGGVFDGDY